MNRMTEARSDAADGVGLDLLESFTKSENAQMSVPWFTPLSMREIISK